VTHKRYFYSRHANLAAHSTKSALADELGDDKIEARLEKLQRELADLQENLYAERKRKVLIVLQGLDTSGKDGTIKHVFRSVNPQGVRVASFKKPTELESAHDFLWRVHSQCPENGEIIIFNRSHYEDYVVPAAHGTLSGKRLKQRLEDIVRFEEMLLHEGVVLFKFFLNISAGEQARRIEERLRDSKKHWKFSISDLTERRYWNDYRRAYNDALAATDGKHRRWHVIPADQKRARDLIVSSILVERLSRLKPRPPRMDPKVLRKIAAEARRQLRIP
jgi:PPK2 family polyphosphate:nucleotide phosphotransferase